MHDTTDTDCTLCPTFRGNAEPRRPDRPPVCEGCRLRLSRLIGELHDLHERLANPDPTEADQRRYRRYDTQGRAQTVWADPLATIGGSGPIPSKPDQPHVSGTPSKSTPANLDHVDLTNEARIPNPTPKPGSTRGIRSGTCPSPPACTNSPATGATPCGPATTYPYPPCPS